MKNNFFMKRLIIFWLLNFTICFQLYAHDQHKADMVIFSFNRPLQLYALLESIREYVTDIGQTYVIYRTSNEAFAKGYEEIKKEFSNITYIQQGPNPYADFKSLVLKATFQSPHEYVLFAVDDNIFTDVVSLSRCIQLMEKWNAYAFYLKMGLHLTDCYSMRSSQRLPSFAEVEPGIFAWRFNAGQHDWAYPNTLDTTLYKKKDIFHDLHTQHYQAPNSFEARWADQWRAVAHRIGLCYECTKSVNIPLNSVQSEWTNPNMNFMTPEQMLELFNAGKKIDRKPLYQIKNKAVHMPYEPTFVERS